MGLLNFIKGIFASKVKTIIAVLVILAIGYFGYQKFLKPAPKLQFQTAKVENGTLVTSVTDSGTIIAGNNVDITTSATGIIKNVYVKNGDDVSQGDVLADLTLDQSSQQKQAAAWASYLSAKSALASAQATLNTLQNTEFTTNQKFINDAVAQGLTTGNPTYIEEDANWLAAEANYKNQQTVIAQDQASLNSALLAYQQTSTQITAPISGVVSNLNMTAGSPVTQTTSSAGTTSSSVLGSITQPGPVQAQVNLSELDSVSVNVGQKVTMTMDAFPDKTFTGRVVSINTNGVVSSGVTTYPATIDFDTAPSKVYPNMSVTAKVQTSVKDNVLLVPVAAVQTLNGQSTVRVLKNGQIQTVNVQVGDSSDTQTEVTSGLLEGDTVVIGVVPTGQSGATSSPFSLSGGRGGFGGGGAVFRGGGGRGG